MGASPQHPDVHLLSSRVLARVVAWVAGVITLVGLVLVSSQDSYPPMPGTLTLELTFPTSAVGQVEPILCTGMFREGDLLVVHYKDESTAVLSYDHWGSPGLLSEPIAFQPGSRHLLRVEMPSLVTYHKPPAGARAWLRVDYDGQAILHAAVSYNGRLPKQIFFGENPIGASADPMFRGTIRTSDGRQPFGGPESYFTRGERLLVWLRAQPWRAIGSLLVSVLIGISIQRFVVSRRLVTTLDWCSGIIARTLRDLDAMRAPSEETPIDASLRRKSLGWFAAATFVASVCYAWVVTGSNFNFNFPEEFGAFYDYQAASFLQGRLDLPEEAIGGEAFEARGKLYGYFGPTPALLRLPFVTAGIAFGKFSRAFMVFYFIGCLIAAYLLLREALRFARHGAESTSTSAAPSPYASCVLVGSVGLGSTIFFLGSRGYVFHEAILAGITFALWSCWFALRYLSDAGRWWIGALVSGVLAVHARPPAGLFALTLLGCVALIRAAIGWRNRRAAGALREPFLIAALCALGFASLNGLAWLKFRTFDPAPLRISRPYTVPGRLKHIDGKSFHLVNIPHNFDTYLLRPNFRFERSFPWFYCMTLRPRRDFPKAKMDLTDHTLALPYAMPSLFALATFGCLGAAIIRPGTRAGVTVIWLAALPMTLALLAAVATAQRYTGDFVPFLVAAAAIGLATIECAQPRSRILLRSVLVALTLAAIAANASMTLFYQGEVVWGVPEEVRQNFQRIRQSVDRWFSP